MRTTLNKMSKKVEVHLLRVDTHSVEICNNRIVNTSGHDYVRL